MRLNGHKARPRCGLSADLYVDRCAPLLCRSVACSHSLGYCHHKWCNSAGRGWLAAAWGGVSIMRGGGGLDGGCTPLPWFVCTLWWQSGAVRTRHPASPLMLCGSQKASEIKNINTVAAQHISDVFSFFIFAQRPQLIGSFVADRTCGTL